MESIISSVWGEMSPPLLPAPECWPVLAPGPDTVVWRRASDARLLVSAGYALLLQVAHPTVGAGVSEHSQFRRDPWGRLLRTLDYVYTMIYARPEEAAAMGRQIRLSHRRIRGVAADGRRYSALEPEAYAWVHATIAEAIVAAHGRFGRPLDLPERRALWSEWRALGRLLGIHQRDLPDSWEGFREYLAAMVEQRLELTPAVGEVLRALGRPAQPPALAALPGWRLVGGPLGHVLELTSVGLLPRVLRERFGVSWSSAKEGELRLLAAGMRATTPVLPPWLRHTGPTYLRARRRAIERNGVVPAEVAASARGH
jgi:uncharacterized protein (DUF2236 family)